MITTSRCIGIELAILDNHDHKLNYDAFAKVKEFVDFEIMIEIYIVFYNHDQRP